MLTGPALLAAEYAPVRSNDTHAGASDQARHCRFLKRLTWSLGEESLAGATEKISGVQDLSVRHDLQITAFQALRSSTQASV
jgi:hypothetical protein